MTTKDTLLVEIEKMIEAESGISSCSFEMTHMLRKVRKLVIADRQRQRAEKEKMIAELENAAHTDDYLVTTLLLKDALTIIKSKEED